MRVFICNSDYHIELVHLNINTSDFKIINTHKFTQSVFTDHQLSCSNEINVGNEQQYCKHFFKSPKSYYRSISKIVTGLRCVNIAFFNDHKPLNKFLLDSFKGLEFELWEDGFNHYQDFFNKFIFFRNVCIKLLLGFYPKNIFYRKIPRNKFITVFDRTNPNFKHPQITLQGSKILFVGQPLVEDHLVNKKKYFNFIRLLQERFDIIYLPHPRETKYKSELASYLKRDKYQIGIQELLIELEAGTILSPFSTILMNINSPPPIALFKLIFDNKYLDGNAEVLKHVSIPKDLNELIRMLEKES